MRRGMGLGGLVLLAVSTVAVAGDVSAVESDGAGGRILMQVPTGVEHEYQLAIGDVTTGEVTPIGKPALDRFPGDLSGPFVAATFDGQVVVSGLWDDRAVVVGPDGSLAEFILEGGVRGVPESMGDGEHFLVADGIYSASTGEFRPLASFGDFGQADIYVEDLVGDWLRMSNENATLYVRLSDLGTVRTLPDSADLNAILLRADGQAVWEEDREGSSALMIADLAAPGSTEVSASEFYSASPFVNLRARVGDYVVAGRTDILLVDPASGEAVGNLTADLDLPPRSNVYSIGDGPLLEVRATGREAELWNIDTEQLEPLGDGSIVHRGDGWALWETGTTMRVIDPASGIVGDIDLGEFGEFADYFRTPLAVGDRVLIQACFGAFGVVIDPTALTAAPTSPICEAVVTDDGRFVAGGTSFPSAELGFCSSPMVVEDLGIEVVVAFPSGCPLAWLEQP